MVEQLDFYIMLNLLKVLKKFTIGRKYVKVVKRNILKTINLMTVRYVDLKFLKKESR